MIYKVLSMRLVKVCGEMCTRVCVCVKRWITTMSLSPPHGLSGLSNSVLLMSCGQPQHSPTSLLSVPPPSSFFKSFILSHSTGGARWDFFKHEDIRCNQKICRLQTKIKTNGVGLSRCK